MKRIIAPLILILGSAYYEVASAQHQRSCVLPSPGLLTCRSATCSRLWLEPAERDALYPKQVMIDLDGDCIYGLTATYDRSVPVDAIKAAIDDHYKQWAVNIVPNSPPYVWRVEQEKFAIQFAAAQKLDSRKKPDEATSHVIYIALGGKSACKGGAEFDK